LTPSFQHCLSPSICSGLIRDENGCGGALFAWFLAALLPFLCFVPLQPSNGHISASIRRIDPIFSALFISIYHSGFGLYVTKIYINSYIETRM
jgi:hypothetical protein